MSDIEHESFMDIRSLDAAERSKLNGNLFKQILIAIFLAGLILASLFYILHSEKIELNVYWTVITVFFILLIALWVTAGKLFKDRLLIKKSVDIEKVYFPEQHFFDNLKQPVAASCTQKQSFGSHANEEQHGKVKVGEEYLNLPKAMVNELNTGDTVEVHRALHSGLLLKLKKK